MEPNHRRCVSCRKPGPKQSFWRIVRAYQSGKVELEGVGRSAYLCPQVSCLEAARKKNKLGRALKALVPEEIYQILGQRLAAENLQSTGCHIYGGNRAADSLPSSDHTSLA